MGKYKLLELALCIGLIAALIVGTATALPSAAISDKLVRLHVVAASDSEEDQLLKLLVRDRTLTLLAEPLDGIGNAGDAAAAIRENIPMLEENLRTFLKTQGSDQAVSVTLQKEAFPTREYSTFALPAGPYTALRVTLDGGAGQNWWCVVFPPLCAASAMEKLPDTFTGLTEGDIALITQADETYVVRFKLMEWLGGVRNWFCRK
ncbi:MAG: stage II sporulation protein R [Oscillospiraceae bacterium]|jgi:stage II sporulation protein R|nr:stage II sporulation protein R [Oscillospiraceae bacterium]